MCQLQRSSNKKYHSCGMARMIDCLGLRTIVAVIGVEEAWKRFKNEKCMATSKAVHPFAIPCCCCWFINQIAAHFCAVRAVQVKAWRRRYLLAGGWWLAVWLAVLRTTCAWMLKASRTALALNLTAPSTARFVFGPGYSTVYGRYGLQMMRMFVLERRRACGQASRLE